MDVQLTPQAPGKAASTAQAVTASAVKKPRAPRKLPGVSDWDFKATNAKTLMTENKRKVKKLYKMVDDDWHDGCVLVLSVRATATNVE